MNEEQFRQLCNVYGFAPSRALRELIDCVRAQEIAACAKVCDNLDLMARDPMVARGSAEECAAAIRARKDKQ
jgi:hypothetical protein